MKHALILVLLAVGCSGQHLCEEKEISGAWMQYTELTPNGSRVCAVQPIEDRESGRAEGSMRLAFPGEDRRGANLLVIDSARAEGWALASVNHDEERTQLVLKRGRERALVVVFDEYQRLPTSASIHIERWPE